jgi:hypothetical protein
LNHKNKIANFFSINKNIVMAFLTKKELSLIRLVKSNEKLTQDQRTAMVQEINYNARLRQDGYRLPVREFIQVLANYGIEKMLKSIK